MKAPFADRLVVHHHNGEVSVYLRVRYWPWRDGVTVWDADGTVVVARHEDVLMTEVP